MENKQLPQTEYIEAEEIKQSPEISIGIRVGFYRPKPELKGNDNEHSGTQPPPLPQTE
jgi:hypothetical protein